MGSVESKVEQSIAFCLPSRSGSHLRYVHNGDSDEPQREPEPEPPECSDSDECELFIASGPPLDLNAVSAFSKEDSEPINEGVCNLQQQSTTTSN